MDRRTVLKASASAALVLSTHAKAKTSFRRSRPSDPAWPSAAKWSQLHQAVEGNLSPVQFPLSVLKTDPSGAAATQLLEDLRNPYFVGDQPGLTQTLGWVDAWASKPSVYALAARNARHVAAAVNFARENNLRVAVKGGGHSYQGTSNAADSLLVWTRHMNDIRMHAAFVPQGCGQVLKPQPAVTVGAGTIGMRAYDAVTTKAGKYVQGGGCTTVCLGGLVQGGGFGSFSKHYGLAAASLLEAEIVTADGQIRLANACSYPDLFWALKGGGGGTFGVITKMTLKLHDLPEYFGVANFTIKAKSEDAYRRLIHEFVGFYRDHLFNDHWGEQVHVRPDNSLVVSMVSYGLDTDAARKAWQPFLDWVRSSDAYSLSWLVVIASKPARKWWDVPWSIAHWPELAFPNPNGNPFIGALDYGLDHLIPQPIFDFDNRPGAPRGNAWWKGDGDQVCWFIWGYESLWLPRSLLESGAQARLSDALFASSRYHGVGLHFNKGLAGAPPEAIAAAKDTAMNPAVLDAFALAIVADGQEPAYPGIPRHEPSVTNGRTARERIHRSVDQLRAVAGETGAYVSESNYFERDWQQAYWGANYARLLAIKRKYDPDGLFIVHNGVGSEEWSEDGFTRL